MVYESNRCKRLKKECALDVMANVFTETKQQEETTTERIFYNKEGV